MKGMSKEPADIKLRIRQIDHEILELKGERAMWIEVLRSIEKREVKK